MIGLARIVAFRLFLACCAAGVATAQSDLARIAEAREAYDHYKDCPAALHALEGVSEQGRSPVWVIYMARANECLGKIKEAEQFYEQYDQLVPNQADVLQKIGQLRYRLTREQTANSRHGMFTGFWMCQSTGSIGYYRFEYSNDKMRVGCVFSGSNGEISGEYPTTGTPQSTTADGNTTTTTCKWIDDTLSCSFVITGAVVSSSSVTYKLLAPNRLEMRGTGAAPDVCDRIQANQYRAVVEKESSKLANLESAARTAEDELVRYLESNALFITNINAQTCKLSWKQLEDGRHKKLKDGLDKTARLDDIPVEGSDKSGDGYWYLYTGQDMREHLYFKDRDRMRVAAELWRRAAHACGALK